MTEKDIERAQRLRDCDEMVRNAMLALAAACGAFRRDGFESHSRTLGGLSDRLEYDSLVLQGLMRLAGVEDHR